MRCYSLHTCLAVAGGTHSSNHSDKRAHQDYPGGRPEVELGAGPGQFSSLAAGTTSPSAAPGGVAEDAAAAAAAAASVSSTRLSTLLSRFVELAQVSAHRPTHVLTHH